MNILGIDYGGKFVGLALADDTLKIATPYKVLGNKDSLMKDLKSIIKTEKIQKIVIGRPLSLSGKETQQTKQTDMFISATKKDIDFPVISFDERLTTKLAHTLLRGPTTSGGRTRLPAGQASSHSVAASIILQNYLDQI
ncbi:Holliday junction resolvase RuvX [Patescibacteria group bacterium AH-259-L07]|nr:Holliday junction resolvase RuvX [Patescibacteria group bacterium AH-259-L07]